MLLLGIVWDSFPLEDVWLKTIKFLSPLGRNYDLPHFTGNRNVVGSGRKKKQEGRWSAHSKHALTGKARTRTFTMRNAISSWGDKEISTPATSRPPPTELRLDFPGTDCWALPFCIHLVQEKLVKGKLTRNEKADKPEWWASLGNNQELAEVIISE